MYLTISPQKLSGNFSQSVKDYVSYLEKENEGKTPEQKELFFNQYKDDLNPDTVIQEIDSNAGKLKKTEPRYYSITINPSKYELKHIQNDPGALKEYTREVMKEYAGSFNREINGRPVNADDIKYFAKIEHQRTFKASDQEIRENAPFLKRIVAVKNEIRKVERGEIDGSVQKLRQELKALTDQAPHKSGGKVITHGMAKEGLQTHVHIIVSRKDASNSYSLSPGSKYRSSEVMMHGKLVKRGFERDEFYGKAEKTFDRMFAYNRNYVESYQARKIFQRDPQKYYSHLNELSLSQKRIAFMILGQAGIGVPHLNISPNQVYFALKQLRKAIEMGARASSIGY